MSISPAIVLFRKDLRLEDNPALGAALASRAPVIPVYIHDEDATFVPKGAQRYWLHWSLSALDLDLRSRGSRLVLRRTNALEALRDLVKATGASAVYAGRRHLRPEMEADAALGASLQALGVGFHLFGGSLLREPAEMRAPSSGGAYMVFSPFWRKLRLLGADLTPLSGRQTAAFPAPKIWPASDDLEDWGLLPRKPNWAAEFPPHWTPGEAGARKTLSEFLGGAATGYAGSREIPALRGTSRLSPHLAFGEIAPAAVWRAVAEHARRNDIPENDAEKYLSELAWREFSQHLLHAFPNMATAPLRGEFRQFPYEDAPERFRAWARGETGFPIVDAGMRELWRTGWMHNRVRMIVASFLTKNLLIDWRRGEQWFAETLLDYDPANNIANWQWVAGCGADAAPYFRIFNPTTQGRKFDPEGEYVRRFVPELDLRSIKDVHEPVAMSSLALDPEGARRRNDYPAPIVDLAASRQRALAAFDQMKKPLAKGENRSHVTRHDKDAFS